MDIRTGELLAETARNGAKRRLIPFRLFPQHYKFVLFVVEVLQYTPARLARRQVRDEFLRQDPVWVLVAAFGLGHRETCKTK